MRVPATTEPGELICATCIDRKVRDGKIDFSMIDEDSCIVLMRAIDPSRVMTLKPRRRPIAIFGPERRRP